MSLRKLRSIKCTSCAAPLTLHGGGHKVRTLNCEFCGAVMDARKHFSVLHKFSHQEKPFSPFKIGMQGQIKGIDFTMIGMVAWEDVEAFQWVDMMLFSPTHGYAWLTYYNAHLVFSRRTRDIPNLNIWNLAPKYEFSAGDKKYKFFERYRAKVVYVAGELTWIAKKDDSSHMIEAIAPPYMYSVEHNGSEIEYGLGEYIENPDTVYKSFGVSQKQPKPKTVHPAQPYHSTILEPLSKAARPFAALAAALVIIIGLFFGGSTVFNEQISSSALLKGSTTHEFTVTRPARLMELTLDTQLKNAWGFFDISVRKGANDIFSFGKNVSYYEGVEGGESWSEGSRSAKAHFKVPEAGSYMLHIKMAEGGKGETGTTPPTTSARITLKQGYISNHYFVLLLILTGIAALAGFLSKIFFESKRWKSVLGEDDE
ncbi:MAG: Unknown protein [uncultured Thiotrichaceae bacterium]|uniref:DUF4178 domain-containing protein n=1 Tax=uncultured Thiotrichaceae bacterium TaxID=298394 RepID=A0A6S6TLL1_9GAMM|nr:MAG: Unknown protein [uncultured Thiotrichaceae bacterium]